MSANDLSRNDAAWQQICAAAELDPELRGESRAKILSNPEAVMGSVYRAESEDDDAEELDMGDVRIVFQGAFEPPAEWTVEDRVEFYGEDDPTQFLAAFIECEAEPADAAFFIPEIGDYIGIVGEEGQVDMYFLYDLDEANDGMFCVLIKEDLDAL